MKAISRVRLFASALLVTGAATLAWGTMRPEAPGYKAKFPQAWTFADDSAKFAELQKLVGKKAPALKAVSWIGEKQDLADLKGQIVLIDFWATWCGPCIAAIPHTNQVAEEYKSQGVTVFGVCCTQGVEKMPSTVKSKGMKYPTAADSGGASAKAFGVQWWPFYVLIDREGVIRATGLRSDAVDKALDELLKEQPFTGNADTGAAKGDRIDPTLLEESRAGDRARLADIEGKPAPKIEVSDWYNSEALTNASLKGKVVVLDFWGTWCGPCMAAIPHNIELYEKYKNKDVVFIGVSTQQGADRIPRVIEGQKIPYPIAVDTTNATIEAYKVNGYPDYYIIGRDGTLLMADVKNTEIDRAIEAALKMQ